ncbi:MAG: trypsin-like peptidase domain-containing protein [Planctomycetes bacterium]|nr:trypsin-like peptidase domain-containing protein [Planctomycetota bacterium]
MTLDVDSGSRDGGGQVGVVFDTVVRVDGAPWVRLFFADTVLPSGSRLLLTAVNDHAVQRHDGASLRAYGASSCRFNGSAVRVQLWAGAATRGNRVRVVRAECGAESPTAPSLCGANDRRVATADRRIARLSVGCTGFLVSADVLITAGHCASQASHVIASFNVPPSSPSGELRMASPNDQYAMLATGFQRLNGGVGADWAIGRLAPNSNTGLRPGDAQGGWMRIGAVPAQPGSEAIRVIGYGITIPLGVLNRAQKSHVGPLVGIAPTALHYRTDTSTGDSGSPLLLERTGDVLGIDTQDGCAAAPTTSFNSGTRIDRGDLQTAVQGLVRNYGSILPLGHGCAGTRGVADLVGGGTPRLGGALFLHAARVPNRAASLLLIGDSSTAWGSIPLPLPLGFLGMTGCTLWVSGEVPLWRIIPEDGDVLAWFTVPNDPRLVDGKVFCQLICPDPAANPNGAVATNAVEVTIGR